MADINEEMSIRENHIARQEATIHQLRTELQLSREQNDHLKQDLQATHAQIEVCRIETESQTALATYRLRALEAMNVELNRGNKSGGSGLGLEGMYSIEAEVSNQLISAKERLSVVEKELEVAYNRIASLEKTILELQQREESAENIETLRHELELSRDQLRDSIRCAEDLRLQISHLQARYREEILKERQRFNAIATELKHAKLQAQQHESIANTMRETNERIKSEKKVLIAELKALRSLGLYEGPISDEATKVKLLRIAFVVVVVIVLQFSILCSLSDDEATRFYA